MGNGRQCRRADIFRGVYPPCFCVCRGNKRVTDRNFVCRGNKGLRNELNWSDKKTGISPSPWHHGCAGIVELTERPRIPLERRSGQECRNNWIWENLGAGRDPRPSAKLRARRVERENSPRKHEAFSQIIASLSTVLCSTGTILRRKSNVKTRTLERHEDAAPKTVLTVDLSAARRFHKNPRSRRALRADSRRFKSSSRSCVDQIWL